MSEYNPVTLPEDGGKHVASTSEYVVPATPVSPKVTIDGPLPTITLPWTTATKAKVSGVLNTVGALVTGGELAVLPEDVRYYVAAGSAVLFIIANIFGVYVVPNTPKK